MGEKRHPSILAAAVEETAKMAEVLRGTLQKMVEEMLDELWLEILITILTTPPRPLDEQLEEARRRAAELNSTE